MEEKVYDVIILGGGPAGLTAAIYTSRAELSTLVIAGNPPGGQLMLTTDVENYPGFPEGIEGPKLIEAMRKQAERFGPKIIDENAAEIKGCEHKTFCVKTNAPHEYRAKTVIVSSGADAKWLDLPSEERLRGKGVSACATCDGFFFKDKVVAVVGGGDSAMEESNFLTRFASKVYVLVRKDKIGMKASKIMQRKAENNPKIEFIFNTKVKEVLGDQMVSGLKLVNNKTNEESELKIDGLFLAIGHRPNTDFLKGFIDLDELGYARATNRTVSSVEGVFIAGDVQDTKYKQAVTAAGFGCMAALDVEKYLAELESGEEKDPLEIAKGHYEKPVTNIAR